MRDASGRDISPFALWQTSMMALAARDPFYLAVFQEELARAPENAKDTERLCTRCHAPAGHEESGGAIDFEALVSSSDGAAQLGREGITCSLCHQIDASNLGQERSFAGGFEVGYEREMMGPHANPFTMPMQMFVNFTPVLGEHIARSELCATCHTVIVGDIVEQATYLEWRSSSVATTAQCQTCHVPTDDADGVRLTGPIARFPTNLSQRVPIGRHRFMGGNAYMLRLIASAESWANTGLPSGALEAAAADAEAHLRTAAKLELTLGGGSHSRELAVRVLNLTGHKLPTGYPSRRMWLHVTVRDGERMLFESGAEDATDLTSATIVPHRDRITAANQVQIWQAVLTNAANEPTHRALDAKKYGKDDRILPTGFSPSNGDRPRVQAVGVEADSNFFPGSDIVTFLLGDIPEDATIDVELCYQSLAPTLIDAIDRSRTPAGSRFVDLAKGMPSRPIVIANAQL